MQVLFLSAVNPYPPISGGQRASYEELKAYARFADVDLLTFYDETETQVPAQMEKNLQEICRTVSAVPMPLKFGKHRGAQMLKFAWSQLTSKPFLYHKFRHPVMRRLLLDRLTADNYDLMHFDHLPSMAYLEESLQFPVIRIGSAFDVVWEIFARYAETAVNPLKKWIFKHEANRIRAYELRRLSEMHAILAISERDQQIFAANSIDRPIYVFKRPTTVSSQPIADFDGAGPVIISLGMLTWMPNLEATIWFHKNVWPIVRRKMPEVRWHIIGADPPANVQAMHDGEHCFVEGFVEELTPFFRQARACIVPLTIGGGVRIKLLDMMSIGLPCISTTIGAQGLENDGILIADEPQQFAESIRRVLMERDLWYRMSQVGREFLRTDFSPKAITEGFESFLSNVLRRSLAQ